MYVVHVLAIYCVLLLEELLFTTKGGNLTNATRIHWVQYKRMVFFCHPFAQVNLDHFSACPGSPTTIVYRLAEEPPFFSVFFFKYGSIIIHKEANHLFKMLQKTSMALDYPSHSIHVWYIYNYTYLPNININNIHVGTSTVPNFMNPMRIISRDHLTSWDPNRRCEGLSVDTRWCSGHRGERFRG